MNAKACSSNGEAYCALAPLFRDGRDSPSAYLERCIAKLETLEPQLHAFVHLDLAGARAAAQAATQRWRAGQPLSNIDGMPVGIKDIIETRDMPTQMGSPIYKGFQPRRDAACVVVLRAAGAAFVGKTVTTEFAAGRPGPTRNPFNTAHTPGGSSSGSAAAVGAGILPAALGTQTMGSIIRPASFCGAFGWKPTHGALPTDGIQPLSSTLDHLGVLAHDAVDAWEVMQVLAGAFERNALLPRAAVPSASKPRKLMRLRTAGWAEADEETRRAFDEALDEAAAHGVEVVASGDPALRDLDEMVIEAAAKAWSVFGWESQFPLRSYRECGADLIGARLHDLLAVAAKMGRDDHEKLLAWRQELRAAVAAHWEEGTAFVSLAASGPAPEGLENTGSRSCAAAWTYVGGPAISLPLMSVRGLPLGLQLATPPGTDPEAFAIARWFVSR